MRFAKNLLGADGGVEEVGAGVAGHFDGFARVENDVAAHFVFEESVLGGGERDYLVVGIIFLFQGVADHIENIDSFEEITFS